FDHAGLPCTESDLLVVELPEGNQPLVEICKALLGAELSIDYAYPLMIGPYGRSALALHVEDHETASQVLGRLGFTLLTAKDLETHDDLRGVRKDAAPLADTPLPTFIPKTQITSGECPPIQNKVLAVPAPAVGLALLLLVTPPSSPGDEVKLLEVTPIPVNTA